MEQIQHSWPEATLQTGLFSSDTLSAPFVVDGILEQWPSRQWTVNTLAQALGKRSLSCRLMQRERERDGPAWEAEGVYIDCQLHQFNDWCRGEAAQDNPLAPFSPQDFSAYIDYKYMSQVFAQLPHMLKEVQWGSLGLVDRDGKDSTLWIGSAGASTPCHYDTYGFNLVAQIQGRKRWVLFPPEQSDALYPTRIPYEESSVFSAVDVASPDTERFPRFLNATPIVVTLEAGQVLYVPRQWWHYVTCTETAVSINTWVEVPEDAESRVQEAVTRLLASSLIPHLTQTVGAGVEESWVNPMENLEGASCNVQYLKAALSSVTPSLTATPDTTPRKSDSWPPNDLRDNTLSPSHSAVPEETTGQVHKGTGQIPEDQVSKNRDKQVLEGRNMHRSSGSTTKQTVAHLDASESQHQTNDEETHCQKLADVQTGQNVVESRISFESRENERPGDGGLVDPAGLLSHVGRTLQGITVHTVDSPFFLSEFQGRKMQAVSSHLTGCHHDSVTQTHSLDKHTSSLKRKCVYSESGESREDPDNETSKLQSTTRSCSAGGKIVTHSDLSPGLKRICQRENNVTSDVSSIPPAFSETDKRDVQISSESSSLCPQTSELQISIHAPRPCCLEHYLKLLQKENVAESGDMDTEKVEEKASVQTCRMSRKETQHSIEEAVLKSVLHPDVVGMIVTKLKEHI